MDDIYSDEYDGYEEVEYCEECGRRISLCDCGMEEFDDLDYEDVDCCPVCGLDEFECRCDHWSEFEDEEEEDF